MLADPLPLVSCLMPTYDRRGFVPHAIRYFLRQDYPHKELLILDDGPDAVADLVPDVPGIRYVRLPQKLTLGAKLNLACTQAAGPLLALWDDDDWYAPRRLSYQVAALQAAQTSVCGINQLLYYDLVNGCAFQYRYPAGQPLWISSLCFTKDLWQQQPFADLNVGMDGLFVRATAPDCVTVLPDATIAVHMIHGHNGSAKQTGTAWWHPHAVENLQALLAADWPHYGPGLATPPPAPAPLPAPLPARVAPARGPGPGPAAAPPVRNVYACLVHEQADCVLDLVRNLHHADPASTILLYNGGPDAELLRGPGLWERYGAVVHPAPRAMQHGYLHQFALDSMAFALDNFAFDTLTIVDSDQLALRAGYPALLGEYLAARPGVGLLSSRPERLTAAAHDVWPVTQAFKEYELWKPWLRRFADGEDKFVHWTFWPATVFTADAARDLARLFRTDAALQHLMAQTNIWATEEIILPTLVRLLGYDIAQNPGSQAFVQYRTAYGLPELAQALAQPDAYWLHPVARQYDDPLRQHTRQHHGHYAPAPGLGSPAAGPPAPALLQPLALLRHVRTLEGWLGDAEADLLLAVAIRACQGAPEPPLFVEVGSYHGKATVLLARVVQALGPAGRVVAIDPHDGQLGAADAGLHTFPPSRASLEANLAAAGVAGVVEVVQSRADQAARRGPIALLLVDGLHDYPSVARDFWHFAGCLRPGGYAVFHDCADYFPGVPALVHELLATGAYREIQRADSLAVLQKA